MSAQPRAVRSRSRARTEAALRLARTRRPATLALLCALLRYPTVSAAAGHRADLRRCAARLAAHLRRIGLDTVTVRPGRAAPVVTADWLHRPGAPVLLVYGHYDVQPAAPRSAWTTDPFRPRLDSGYVHARGASDDKGQLTAHLAAIEAWLATGGPPVNLRVVLDGEEEIGSPTLSHALRRGPAYLRADLAVVSDTRMRDAHTPVLVDGLRGSLAARIEVTGPATALHAGAFGGAVAEPARTLCALVAGLHTPGGRIAVRGFYDDVRPLDPVRRARLARDGPRAAELLAPAGAGTGAGEPGYSAFERTTVRPAVVVTGLSGTARGAIPARASAHLSVRLVPGQRPAAVARALRTHLADRTPRTVHSRLRVLAACPPYTLDPEGPGVDAATRACVRVFGRGPLLLPSGGSIPFVAELAAVTGTQTLLLGFGLPDDRIHAPDERFPLLSLERATDTCVELYGELGES
ncbi:M20/M25/M40 family metallo-hydrolase [Streptomyces sp. NBC_01478]|uniref:M20/M25/M40 family metallo-hydrolase n=1 Tax=Streptomyces sp. NBC_01478 TaxID=2903882 RepID=UPI002E3057B1|nr:M20/M25/M40 family metallo-hydrolase [Streptomyces sp. NBC_01478]